MNIKLRDIVDIIKLSVNEVDVLFEKVGQEIFFKYNRFPKE